MWGSELSHDFSHLVFYGSLGTRFGGLQPRVLLLPYLGGHPGGATFAGRTHLSASRPAVIWGPHARRETVKSNRADRWLQKLRREHARPGGWPRSESARRAGGASRQ